MTIPNLIVKYQKEQTAIKLKKIYSILGQALERAKVDYGDPITWDWSETGYQRTSISIPPIWAKKYVLPYLKIDNDWVAPTIEKTMYGYGKTVGRINAKTISGSTQQRCSFDVILPDGAGICFQPGGYSWSNDPWVWITVDLNGNKKPNVYGKDIFNFFYFGKTGFRSVIWVSWTASIQSYMASNGGRNAAIEQCKSNYIATYCADLIMMNNWKIPDDYPW